MPVGDPATRRRGSRRTVARHAGRRQRVGDTSPAMLSVRGPAWAPLQHRAPTLIARPGRAYKSAVLVLGRRPTAFLFSSMWPRPAIALSDQRGTAAQSARGARPHNPCTSQDRRGSSCSPHLTGRLLRAPRRLSLRARPLASSFRGSVGASEQSLPEAATSKVEGNQVAIALGSLLAAKPSLRLAGSSSCTKTCAGTSRSGRARMEGWETLVLGISEEPWMVGFADGCFKRPRPLASNLRTDVLAEVRPETLTAIMEGQSNWQNGVLRSEPSGRKSCLRRRDANLGA